MRLPVSPDPNICGVVRADVHTGEGHHDGEYPGDDPPSSVGQQQSEGDGRGGGCVVAGEREVGGLVDEQVVIAS